MLAQAFKSANELGITDEELTALIRVLGMFERGEVKRARAHTPAIPNGFNMSSLSHTDRCNTVACIKGWAQIVGGEHLFSSYPSTKNDALYTGLFLYSKRIRFRINEPAQAATALRSYLTTGDAKWHEAIAGDEK